MSSTDFCFFLTFAYCFLSSTLSPCLRYLCSFATLPLLLSRFLCSPSLLLPLLSIPRVPVSSLPACPVRNKHRKKKGTKKDRGLYLFARASAPPRSQAPPDASASGRKRSEIRPSPGTVFGYRVIAPCCFAAVRSLPPSWLSFLALFRSAPPDSFDCSLSRRTFAVRFLFSRL